MSPSPRLLDHALYLGAGAALGPPWLVLFLLRTSGMADLWLLIPSPAALLAGTALASALVAIPVRPLTRLGWRGWTIAVLAAPLAGGALVPGLSHLIADPSLVLAPRELLGAFLIGVFGAGFFLGSAWITVSLSVGCVWALHRVDLDLEGMSRRRGASRADQGSTESTEKSTSRTSEARS